MPLTDLVRYFNVADQAGDSTLYLEQGRAAAWHRGFRLGSLFRPVVDLAAERIVGHQAILALHHDDGLPATLAALYDTCQQHTAVIALDRLCRTLHALNFLAQQHHAGGYLQVSVHPRHLLAVPSQHGLVYEAILKRCGLAPQDIVLQVDATAVAATGQLAGALASYRERGYRLALTLPPDLEAPDSILTLQPDIVQWTGALDAAALGAFKTAGTTIERIDIDNGQTWQASRAAGIQLGQGELFGSAASTCRPTHSRRTVSYNASSSTGAQP